MSTYQDPIKYLRRLHDSGQHNDVVQMIRDQRSVLEKYGPIFSEPWGLDHDTFAGFLKFENNRHWWNLHREEAVLLRHFDLVRDVIGELVDPDVPIDERVDAIGDLPGFSTDLYTAILLVVFPEDLGVRSAISDSAMKRLELFPDLDEDASVGLQYALVNEMLGEIADAVGVDLWTLDALWWGVEKEHDPTKHFVKKGRSTSDPKPRRTSSSSPRKPAAPKKFKPVAATFVCQNCFSTKQLNLASDTPGLCIDCA